LLEHQLAHATLVAPITGTVISEDLNDRIGAPVELGELMFEVAPLDSLRADLAVPEDRITDLVSDDPDAEQFRGTLASVAHPGDYVPFVVEHVNPVAEVKEQENVFIVRVRLLE
ncbi:MAG: HlyD family efflux transporter periplasmic adaptor subunit, partial [Actinobacteria bacterium]|nr:HlyD family secretion protein [Actinomycetota bacterium]NIX25179.1 HlyD family efflux transporter periplasmic adaptor subunit [Actinomycetota bacterium]